jgi:hypothetical protein
MPNLDSRKLLAFIDEAGLSYHQTGKSFIFDCPKCHREKKLYLRKRDGKFTCWTCPSSKGFKGAPEFALEALTGMSLEHIRDALYGDSHYLASLALDISLRDFQDEDSEFEDEIEYEELPDLCWPYHCLPLTYPGALNGVSYLESRGVPIEVASQYDIRYSPEKRSVAFPIWVGTRLVGYQYRTIDPTLIIRPDGTPIELLKTISSPDIPRDRCVMFSNRLTCDHAILCEGPFDALKCHLCSGGNIASMGKKVSIQQIELLLKSGIKKLYLGLDPDAADEINPILRRIDGVEGYLMELPCKPGQGKVDLGSLSMEEARECFLAARPMPNNRMHLYFG